MVSNKLANGLRALTKELAAIFRPHPRIVLFS